MGETNAPTERLHYLPKDTVSKAQNTDPLSRMQEPENRVSKHPVDESDGPSPPRKRTRQSAQAGDFTLSTPFSDIIPSDSTMSEEETYVSPKERPSPTREIQASIPKRTPSPCLDNSVSGIKKEACRINREQIRCMAEISETLEREVDRKTLFGQLVTEQEVLEDTHKDLFSRVLHEYRAIQKISGTNSPIDSAGRRVSKQFSEVYAELMKKLKDIKTLQWQQEDQLKEMAHVQRTANMELFHLEKKFVTASKRVGDVFSKQ
ncbi:hypothetical protein N7520_003533 [Penicillium odoratum]|uniref:uncharacterized protein n=1 Tax=Penicillium odoratum TaxID=1167516 RepID=UPI00254668B6|nr:uncharacterized protein N7520_003533 [Penicillium odoratum]KAJ5768974.1 hypothetical protein N7520_003533 [Penicillium odoratum]